MKDRNIKQVMVRERVNEETHTIMVKIKSVKEIENNLPKHNYN
jgi:hypothetical protein